MSAAAQVRFSVERTTVGNLTDVAYIGDGEDPFDRLTDAVVEGIRTDVEVTISGVTMFLAAWQDPEHWGDEWRELGAEPGDEREYVLRLLSAARES